MSSFHAVSRYICIEWFAHPSYVCVLENDQTSQLLLDATVGYNHTYWSIKSMYLVSLTTQCHP